MKLEVCSAWDLGSKVWEFALRALAKALRHYIGRARVANSQKDLGLENSKVDPSGRKE